MSSHCLRVIAAAGLLVAAVGSGAQALDCSGIPAWNAATVYSAGAKVTRAFVAGSSNPGTTNNMGTVGATYAYRNTNGGRWGDDPAAGTSWSVWGALTADGNTIAGSGQSASACGASSGPTPTATTAVRATATRTATAGATATATTGGSGCTAPAFASCTAYAVGASVSFQGTKYTAIGAISSTRDCPPSSPYDPPTDNWWRNDGACSGGPTPTATRTPTATATSGGPTATRTNTATATPTTTSGGGGFPARFAAPYVATWNNPDLAALASSTGHKLWTLAFIINGGGACNPMWNGDTALTTTYNVSGLRAAGGDVIVSFGGAAGTEIAASCSDVASTQAAYQRVINAVGARALDLDIESGFESDTVSIDRRNKAMKNLQAANPGLRVDYTLAVDRAGLPAAQINLLRNAVSNGVSVASVNIMAMDYGPCYSDMGQAAVDAANATKNQLAANGISARVGVTPMIGVNDVSCENFTTNDASVLVNYAQGQTYINLLAYWVQDADPSRAYINIFKSFH
jgi:hypothetical protein